MSLVFKLILIFFMSKNIKIKKGIKIAICFIKKITGNFKWSIMFGFSWRAYVFIATLSAPFWISFEKSSVVLTPPPTHIGKNKSLEKLVMSENNIDLWLINSISI